MKCACFVGLLFCVATVGSCYAQEVLQSDSKPISVVYKTGEVEHYIVKWTGQRVIDHHEDGHPSEPLKGWLTDTRQCYWSIDSSILRRVYLLNKNGQEFAQAELTTPLVNNFANKGSDFVVTALRPENCGDANARYQSDVANSAQYMAQAFPPNVAKDYQTVISTMKGWPNVKDVQPK